MGNWGAGRYQDDLALDIKDSYLSAIAEGNDSEEALKLILNEYSDSLNDADDAPIVWFVLADLQMQKGWLSDTVRQNALEQLQYGAALDRWKKDCCQLFEQRKHVLHELERELISFSSRDPRPPKTKLCRYYEWENGDVFAIPILGSNLASKHLSGRYFLLHKIGNAQNSRNRQQSFPIVRIKITQNNQLPQTADDFEQLEYVR